MRYLVVTQTGLFGPADVVQLSQWAAEGRLSGTTILEEEGTGKRVPASSVAGMSFSMSSQSPSPNRVMVVPPASPSLLQPNLPIAPQAVSNYPRAGDAPPLFLAAEIDGKRELLYSFLLAIGAPLIALIHIYGIAMAFGGVYCAVVALQRGRKLGILSLLLNILAIPAAFLIHFGWHWLF